MCCPQLLPYLSPLAAQDCLSSEVTSHEEAMGRDLQPALQPDKGSFGSNTGQAKGSPQNFVSEGPPPPCEQANLQGSRWQ